MLLYRLGKTQYADSLTGEGPRLNGGRWNHKRTPCIYAADTRALCLLEYSAHIKLHEIPRALSFTIFEVPDDAVKEIPIAALPGNWMEWPYENESRDLGTKLLREKKHLILKIPSAVLPEEFIYIINPLHERMNEVKLLKIEDYAYDVRLKY